MHRATLQRRAAFLVECFAPASESVAPAGRVEEACAELRTAGVDVTYLGAVLVPGDELAFHLFAGDDAADVLEVGRRARLWVERVVPAVAIAVGEAPPLARPALPVGVEADGSAAHAASEIGP
jgi:hypothetical protein